MGSQRFFQNKWWVVVGSFISLIVGAGGILVLAAGIFLKPVGQELHFGRGVTSTAISMANIVEGLLAPFVGRMMDRYGVRAVMLPLIALFAIATVCLSLLTASATLLLIMFALQGVGGTAQGTTGSSMMITQRFDNQRGLALGIALTGVGVGVVLIPQYARVLLQHFGWRAGYIGLGIAIFVLAFIPVAVFFREPDEIRTARKTARESGKAGVTTLPGEDFSAAVRTGKYWAITIGVFLGLVVIDGAVIHLVPLLTDRGMSLAAAVSVVSVSGMALIAARLVSGYLLDVLFAPYVAIGLLLMPFAAIAILASGVGGSGPLVGAVLLGLSIGAEFDVMSFILSRYFGARSFGALYGIIVMSVNFANAVGSALMGWCFQFKHSYTPMFIIFEGLLVVAIILFARLGPYRYPAPRKEPANKLKATAS